MTDGLLIRGWKRWPPPQTTPAVNYARVLRLLYTHVELDDQTAAIGALPGPPG